MAVETTETVQPRLHRNLNVWEAIGISLALMAPSMAANINPQASAGYVGRATPTAFALAFVGVLLVAYTFVRLTQRFHHSGSVYGFVGATMGPLAGMVAGLALAGTYLFYAVTTGVAGGRFAASFLNSLGIWHNPPDWAGFLLAIVGLAVVAAIAITPARSSTTLLVIVESITVALILIVSVVIFFKLAGHGGPGKLGLTSDIFKLPTGTPFNSILLAVVFGFLSFAGFEAASTLGEETKRPNRDIPRAIIGVAVFGGVYYFVVTAIETMGFGTTGKGPANFIASGSLLGDLGSSYVSSWLGTTITLGTMISAFSCALACVVGSARMVFAMSRDGMLPSGLSAVSQRFRTPFAATFAIIAVSWVVIVVTWVFHGVTLTLFTETGAIGTLILLVAYILATIGMVRLVFFGERADVPRWQLVVPVLGILLLAYTLYGNVIPWPSGVALWGPLTAIGWLVVATAYTALRPAATKRAGEHLMRAEGLTGTALPDEES